MPRGQYDRAAAKARRAVPNDWERQQMKDAEAVTSHFTWPAFPYENKPIAFNVFPEDMTDEQRNAVKSRMAESDFIGRVEAETRLAAANALIAKYAAVLKRNGLWLDE